MAPDRSMASDEAHYIRFQENGKRDATVDCIVIPMAMSQGPCIPDGGEVQDPPAATLVVSRPR